MGSRSAPSIDGGRHVVARIDRVLHHLGGHRLLARPHRRPQGASFLGFFLFSIVFFPAALIVAFMVQDRNICRPSAAV
jgi:hypothetical protein